MCRTLQAPLLKFRQQPNPLIHHALMKEVVIAGTYSQTPSSYQWWSHLPLSSCSYSCWCCCWAVPSAKLNADATGWKPVAMLGVAVREEIKVKRGKAFLLIINRVTDWKLFKTVPKLPVSAYEVATCFIIIVAWLAGLLSKASVFKEDVAGLIPTYVREILSLKLLFFTPHLYQIHSISKWMRSEKNPLCVKFRYFY